MKQEFMHAVAKYSQVVDGSNPVNRVGVGAFDWPSWVGYTFGSLLLVIGIAFFFLYNKRFQQRKEAYKKEQLAEYNKKYNKKETNYSRTGMYLPAWEKAKASFPAMIAVTLGFVGVAWIVGNTLIGTL